MQSRRAVLIMLAAFYALGLASVASLPPFEGFDETGHYSYVRQLATEGSWPRRGEAMAAEVDDYLKVAPAAPAMSRAMRYADLAGASDAVKAAAAAAVHAPAPARDWRPGGIVNWEAQHPPLYYMLLAPAFRLAADWSLGARLFLLRSLSYTLAWSGLAIAAYAALTMAGREGPGLAFALAPVLWPVLLPMWFPEMARVGNDSLLVPIAGLTWLCLRDALADSRSISAVRLGVVMGLGLLTKATFLPVTAAAFVLLLARAWESDAAVRRRRVRRVALCAVTLLLIAGWWYVGQAMRTGSVIGSNDSINLAGQGGIWQGLHRRASAAILLRMLGTFDLSTVWDGTWSFVIPPLPFVLPMMATVPTLVAFGMRDRLTAAASIGAPTSGLGRKAATFRDEAFVDAGTPGTRSITDLIAPLTLALFCVALVYHSLVLVASGSSGAPAWYLHAFVPVLWPLLAWGCASALHRPWLKGVLVATLVYAAVFLAVVMLCDAALYAGCAGPVDDGRFFALGQTAACLLHPTRIVKGLSLLAYPRLAACLWLAGISALTVGIAAVAKRITDQPLSAT